MKYCLALPVPARDHGIHIPARNRVIGIPVGRFNPGLRRLRIVQPDVRPKRELLPIS